MLFLVNTQGNAQLRLIKDLNQKPDISDNGSSRPEQFIEVNGLLYFSALGTETGRELWRTDGTIEGTVLVKDIAAGGSSSNPRSLIAIGNILYFLANDGIVGEELWRTDGTANGTHIVKDIFPGNSSSQISSMIAFNGMLLINAIDPIKQGYSLWKSDGTGEGTSVLTSADGIQLGYPRHMTILNDYVYFGATDNTSKQGLWRTNGTPAGTTLVKHMETGLQSDNPSLMINANGTLYFASGDYTELWKSDGTEAGTVMVKVFYSSYAIRSIVQGNGLVYLEANKELWKSDGTEAGTELVMGSQSGLIQRYYPRNLTTLDNKLFFTVNLINVLTGQSYSHELWSSDQTETTLIKSFAGVFNVAPMEFKLINGLLYFQGSNYDGDVELWRSDGTSDGTSLFKNINTVGSSSPSGFTLYKGMIYFSANNGVNGSELWRTDGTEVGTLLIKDINERTIGSHPSDFVTIGNTTFFVASDGERQVLWKTDGTETGTRKVMNETTSPVSIDLSYLCKAGSTLFFVASTDEYGKELWKSDGTSEGTVMVKDIRGGTSGSNPNRLFVIDNTIYFAASDATGVELWKSDGTEAGTVQVKDIHPGAASSSPREFTNLNGVLFFAANGTQGKELWKSNGTTQGTVLVKDIWNMGNNGSDPHDLAVIGNYLYFTANDGIHSYELWRSDGTEQGTLLIKDINPGPYPSFPQYFTALGDFVLFSAGTEQEGFELWKTDGTESGTVLVEDIVKGSNSSQPYGLIQYRDLVFFAVRENDKHTLWKSNGTEEGTTLVKSFDDLRYASAKNFQIFEEVLYFTIVDSDKGQLWRTIGTECSTIRLTTPQEGFIGDPLMVQINNSLLLNFGSFIYGHELYAYDLGKEIPTCDQSITFQEMPTLKTYGDAPLTLEASATSGLPIVFTSSNSEVAVIENNVVTIVGAGTVVITATQPGNTVFKTAANVEQVLTINKASQVLMFDVLAAKEFGDNPFPLIASSTSGLPVTFTSSNIEVATIKDNIVTILGVGTVTITASQEGDEFFNAASAIERVLTINKASQVLTFDVLAGKQFGDDSFTLIASTTSGLPISFESSNRNVATISDNVVTIVGVGVTTITATQGGNTYYLAASPVEQNLFVSKALQEILFMDIPHQEFDKGTFKLTATATSGLPVTYISSHPEIASISGDVVTFHKAGMTVAIAANQAGNENYEPAIQVVKGLMILKAPQTITFEPLMDRILGEAPFTLNATSNASLPITYESSNASVAAVEGDMVTLWGAGTTTITARHAGNDTFESASSEQTLVVTLVTEAEEAPRTNLMVYPNPSRDKITVVLKDKEKATTLSLVNTNGKSIAVDWKQKEKGVYEASVASLTAGVYVIRVQMNTVIRSIKFVKE